jgi:hypothetical protein
MQARIDAKVSSEMPEKPGAATIRTFFTISGTSKRAFRPNERVEV